MGKRNPEATEIQSGTGFFFSSYSSSSFPSIPLFLSLSNMGPHTYHEQCTVHTCMHASVGILLLHFSSGAEREREKERGGRERERHTPPWRSLDVDDDDERQLQLTHKPKRFVSQVRNQTTDEECVCSLVPSVCTCMKGDRSFFLFFFFVTFPGHDATNK